MTKKFDVDVVVNPAWEESVEQETSIEEDICKLRQLIKETESFSLRKEWGEEHKKDLFSLSKEWVEQQKINDTDNM